MRTNTKEVNAKIQAYILERIDLTDYFDTDKPATALLDIFRSEYSHEIKRRGEQGAFMEWLAGLPSCISIHFYHDQVDTVMKGFGLPNDKGYTNVQTWDLYRKLLYREVCKLARKENK